MLKIRCYIGLLLLGCSLCLRAQKEYVYAQRDNREIIFYIKKGDAAHQNKKYLDAVRFYTKALSLKDNVFRFILLIKRANMYSETGKLDKAIADYTAAIQQRPATVVAYNNRALCYLQKGMLEEALRDQTKILQLDKRTSIYYNNRGLTYAKQQKFDEAIADYTKALQLNPQNHLYYYNRGNALFSKEEYSEALKDYRAALDLHPRYADAYYYRALCFSESEDYERALEEVGQAIRLKPQERKYWELRGNLYLKMNRFVLALQDYNRLIKAVPKNVKFHLTRADILDRLEQNQAALEDYKKVLLLNMTNYEARVGVERMGLKMSKANPQPYVARLRLLDKEKANRAEAAFVLSKHFLSATQYTEAQNYILRCIELNKKNPDYFAFAGLISFREGKVEEAARYLKTALSLDSVNKDFLALKKQIPDYERLAAGGIAGSAVQEGETDQKKALEKNPETLLPQQDKPKEEEESEEEEDEEEEEEE